MHLVLPLLASQAMGRAGGPQIVGGNVLLDPRLFGVFLEPKAGQHCRSGNDAFQAVFVVVSDVRRILPLGNPNLCNFQENTDLCVKNDRLFNGKAVVSSAESCFGIIFTLRDAMERSYLFGKIRESDSGWRNHYSFA